MRVHDGKVAIASGETRGIGAAIGAETCQGLGEAQSNRAGVPTATDRRHPQHALALP